MSRLAALLFVGLIWVAAIATSGQHYYPPGGGGDGADTAAANTFTALNKFTAGLEAYEDNNAANAEGVAIGTRAGATDATDSIHIGYEAGYQSTGASAVRVGRHAGFDADSSQSVIVGHAAGQYAYDAASAVILGYQAARNPAITAGVHSFSSVIIGALTLTNGVSNQTGTAIGAEAGENCTDAVATTLLGFKAGEGATNCRESILIGNQAGQSLSRNRTLVIDSDPTLAPGGTSALIYGEIDNRTLQLNAGTGWRYRMESVTTTKTPAINESGEFYYTGDTDGQTFTLVNDPTPIGAAWKWVVTQTQASNSMSIAPPAGETLRDGTSTCSTITATAIGAKLEIMVTAAGAGGHFTVIDKLGTWTCNP